MSFASRAGILNSIQDAVGCTPLIRAKRLAPDFPHELLLKCEFMNPGGSVKDRITLRMVMAAEQRGELRPGGTLVEATAGNTGVGLALVAAERGYRLIVVMTTKASSEKVELMRALGADVVIVPKEHPPDHPESFLNKAKSIAASTPGAWHVDQFGNADNIAAHYEGTAEELWEQTGGRIDAVVVGVGTGGSLSGIGRLLKQRDPRVQMILADPAGSILKNMVETGEPGEFRPSLVEGIGGSTVPRDAQLDLVDRAIAVSDRESIQAALQLLRREGIFAGASSGCNVAAALKYGAEMAAGGTSGLRIVTLITDGGRGYLSTLHNPAWRRAQNLG